VRSQQWNPEQYAQTAGFVAELGLPLIGLLAPRPGERILDLGCGDGVLGIELRDKGAEVVGVDASAEMVAAARARGLDARVMDAAKLSFAPELAESFDAVFSNAALHWMRDLPAVCDGVFGVLRPGGRFVGELGGEGNVAAVVAALSDALRCRPGVDAAALDPWVFPSTATFRGWLESSGFTVARLDAFARPTPLPGDIGAWLETFARSFLDALDGEARSDVVAEVRRRLAPDLLGSDGIWRLDYVRLRFAAAKPA
jgi:trans-aconitate methyltransferase